MLGQHWRKRVDEALRQRGVTFWWRVISEPHQWSCSSWKTLYETVAGHLPLLPSTKSFHVVAVLRESLFLLQQYIFYINAYSGRKPNLWPSPCSHCCLSQNCKCAKPENMNTLFTCHNFILNATLPGFIFAVRHIKQHTDYYQDLSQADVMECTQTSITAAGSKVREKLHIYRYVGGTTAFVISTVPVTLPPLLRWCNLILL